MTVYHVLRATSPDTFTYIGTEKGHSPEQVLRSIDDVRDGSYLVVPLQNYNKLIVDSEAYRKVRVSRG